MSSVPAKKNRRWIWFFVVVVLMAIVATVVLVAFNLQQQLKPEQLAAARKLWREQGPKNYTMAYTTRVDDSPDTSHYWVKVHAGRAIEAKFNGQPEPPERLAYYGMESLFNFIERFMEIDVAPGSPKTYVRGVFMENGGLRWYVRRIMGGHKREEIAVETFTAEPS